MSSRDMHVLFGTIAGAAVAGLVAHDQQLHHVVIEVMGGALGGWVGAQVPDWVEPAIHSYHRSTFHSVATATASVGAARRHGGAALSFLRTKANEFEARLQTEQDPLRRLGDAIVVALLRLLAGALSGLLSGYLSHLALDATTPRSIPLLTSGF